MRITLDSFIAAAVRYSLSLGLKQTGSSSSARQKKAVQATLSRRCCLNSATLVCYVVGQMVDGTELVRDGGGAVSTSGSNTCG